MQFGAYVIAPNPGKCFLEIKEYDVNKLRQKYKTRNEFITLVRIEVQNKIGYKFLNNGWMQKG